MKREITPKQFSRVSDESIDEVAPSESYNSPGDHEFWKAVEVTAPETKKQLTLRLDREIYDWFKSQGRGYQTRMNAVLRAYIKAQKNDN